MKQWEIIREAQENGAKIRQAAWKDKTQWMFWDKERNTWMSKNGYATCIYTGEGNALELYIEPIKTFSASRAMYWLERGKMVRRLEWYGKFYIKKSGTSIICNQHLHAMNHWFHADWHLCDEQGNYVPEPEEGV